MDKEATKKAQKLVNAATEVKDFLVSFPGCRHYKCGDQLLEISFSRRKEMTDGRLAWCLKLCRVNMEGMYKEVWGWSNPKKKKQLAAEASRYLIAWAPDEAKGRRPVGYINFRFEKHECEPVPVLYCYELQLEPEVQRKGLGQAMMRLLELIAVKQGMERVMLTVFRNNEAAKAMYAKMGYTEDEISPGYDNKSKADKYIILSKFMLREANNGMNGSSECGCG